MKFDGFHHIGLFCADSEKSLAFYTALGGKETFRFPMGDSGKTIYLVDMGGNAVIEIIPKGDFSPGEEDPLWAHICLNTADCRAAYDLALSLGAQARIAPKNTKLGTLVVINSFVFGPDNEIIEFFQITG